MPRQSRLDIAGIPQHVIQRGNDRQACFFAKSDYLCYLRELHDLVLRECCAVHAYALMANHVHLLITPSATGQIAHLMQSLGRRYVRYVNDRYQRTGTLWEGRYKACLVDCETYLLKCYRYIELNPVRAGMVANPGDYPWSSHKANANGKPDPLIRPHPSYLALGDDEVTRQANYQMLVAQALSDDDLAAIRLTLQRQHALGSGRFRAGIEAKLGQRAGPAVIGRPRKTHSVKKSAL